jgi:phage FluMu protein Com
MTITCPKCNKDILEEAGEANKVYCSSCKEWSDIKAENSGVIEENTAENVGKAFLGSSICLAVCLIIGAIMAIVFLISGHPLLAEKTGIAIMGVSICLFFASCLFFVRGLGVKEVACGIFFIAVATLLFFLFSLPLAKDFVFVITTAPHVTAVADTSTIQRRGGGRRDPLRFSIRSQDNVLININGSQYNRLQRLRGSRITVYYLPNSRILLNYQVIE